MFRRFIPACLVILAACSSATSSPATSNQPTVESSVANTDKSTAKTLTTCQTVRDDAPKKVEYVSWDSPGVITTDVDIDKQRNKFIAGYMTDENDFNFIHNLGRYIGIDGRGRVYGTMESLKLAPFLWSRDL